MMTRTRFSRSVTILVAAGVSMLLGGCAGSEETDGDTVSLQIELDAFSGRENPVFTLEGTEAETVLAAFGDVLPLGTPQSPPSILGFRGFVLMGEALPGDGTLRSIRVVSDGYYLESTTGDTRFVDDSDPYGVLLPIMEDSFGVSLEPPSPDED